MVYYLKRSLKLPLQPLLLLKRLLYLFLEQFRSSSIYFYKRQLSF
jgi:hypothetical protein